MVITEKKLFEVGEWGSGGVIFTIYPIIFTIIIGYYRTQ